MTWERCEFDKMLSHAGYNILVTVQDGELVIKDFEDYSTGDHVLNQVHSHEIPLSDLTWLLHVNEAANDSK